MLQVVHISFGHHQLAPKQLSLMSAPTKICLLSYPLLTALGDAQADLAPCSLGHTELPRSPKPSLGILGIWTHSAAGPHTPWAGSVCTLSSSFCAQRISVQV